MSAQLIDEGIQGELVGRGDGGVGDPDRHVVPLNGGQHPDQIIPGARHFKAVLVKDILAVKQHADDLRLRQRVHALIPGQRRVSAGAELRDHLIKIIKLPQILRGVAQRVVHGIPRIGGDDHIRAVAGNHRAQQRRGINQLDVDLDAALRREGVIDHGFQHDGLVTPCQYPYVKRFLVRVHVAQRVVICKVGSRRGNPLMPQPGQRVLA